MVRKWDILIALMWELIRVVYHMRVVAEFLAMLLCLKLEPFKLVQSAFQQSMMNWNAPCSLMET
jgi:hypothetical protein